MFTRARFLILPVLLVLGLSLLAAACSDDDKTDESVFQDTSAKSEESMAKDTMEESEESMAKESVAMSVPDKIVAPHFVDSSPLHGDVLAEAPQVVVLNFNFNLHDDSAIEVSREGEAVSLGPRMISENRLSMRADLQNDSKDGVYQVSYKACWPDGSCHEGSVAFIVDGSTTELYEDLRGQLEVTVYMREGPRFDPARIIISPGTRINWINEDSSAHFVNSDPHPSHNVLGDLNSFDLRSGDSYSHTFTDSGAWGYHCSAHFGEGMTAQVLVRQIEKG